MVFPRQTSTCGPDPSTRYPAVAVIPLDTELEIHGCLADIPWCDVSFYRGRGWVAAQYIATDYRRNRVDLQPRYYRPLGIPTITFNLGNYWERNYRNRDFYRDRERWGRSDYDGNRRDRDRRRPVEQYGNNDDDGFNQDRERNRRERDRERRRVIEENNNIDQFEGDNRRRNDNFREEQRRNDDRQREARPGTCEEGDVECAIEKAR